MMTLARLTLLAAVLAAPVHAQIGRRVAIQAGTPEDKALQEIGAATDAASKLELLKKFITEFSSSSAVLAGYEMLIAHYQGEKNYPKVYETADKALAFDPENFNIAFSAMRAAQEANDAPRLFHYGAQIGELLTRFKASAPPSGTDAESWASQKRAALSEVQDNVAYTEYTLFSTAANMQSPEQKAQLLERFVLAFPDSQYSFMGATVAADAYRQANQGAKLVEFGAQVLAREPNHYGMLVQLADYGIDNKEFEKSSAYATKALGILNVAAQPANLTPEQWTQQKNLQMGLAHYAIGRAHLEATRDAQAVESFKSAAPLLKLVNFYYARCLYYWGFALSRQKKAAEARPILQEAAALDTPFKPHAQDLIGKLGAPGKAKKR